MTHATAGRMRLQPQRNRKTGPAAGLAPGTIVYTLDGALPVEYLTPGDRIVTRAGARVLRAIGTRAEGFHLRFDAPEVIYADGAEVATGACA